MSDSKQAALQDPLHITEDESFQAATTQAKRRAVTQGLDSEQVKKVVEEAAEEQSDKQKQAQEASKKSPGVVGKDA
jgi:hypothetical protein